MITEDYCSDEVAKLLREKGFNEPVTELNRLLFEEGKKPLLKITHQKAMKWLMEVHKLFVNVCPSVEGYYWTERWHSYVDNLGKRYPFGKFIGTFNTHEEATEASIKYCLENLI